MGKTVVVVDTNIFYRCPLLRSDVWSQLISKAAEWDLHFAIPSVVQQEALSVVRRKWQKVRDAVAKQTLVNEMGLAATCQSTAPVGQTPGLLGAFWCRNPTCDRFCRLTGVSRGPASDDPLGVHPYPHD